MRKFRILALMLVLIMVLAGCGTGNSTPAAKDIVILYTNDAHCGIEDGMGYQGLSAAKRALLAAGNKVLLVDNGDAVQGDTIGTLSKGEYIIDIMNKLGYDVATPGNHEFDYGMDQFNKLVEKADFDYISCNFVDKDGNPVLKPYVIKEADGVKIAFVGISTPKTITTSTPTYFQDGNGNYIYGFMQDDTGEKLYAAVQSAVDAARKEGAKYVIAMAHLGIETDCQPWTSSDVIVNTSGIDVVLDGHSHSTIAGDIVKNKEGKDVILTSTGTKLANIGCLTNPTNLENTFKSVKGHSISDTTIQSYLGMLQDAFMLEKAIRYDIKGKHYINTPSKYYFEDVGLRNARLNYRQIDGGHLMENIIYNELRIRGYSVDVGQVEVRTTNAEGKKIRKLLEVDFICNSGNKRMYIQSALDMPTPEKIDQETNSLRHINDGFPKIVIVGGLTPSYVNTDGISIMNVIDFLKDTEMGLL